MSLVLIFLFCTSCGEYEQLEQMKVLRKTGDSLYAVHKDSLRKALDTLCDERYDSLYQQALDSLKAKQIQDIRVLIK